MISPPFLVRKGARGMVERVFSTPCWTTVFQGGQVGIERMIREAIEALVEGRNLSEEEAALAMEEIMGGEATPAQFGAFVTALRLKGETPDEIAGMAGVMRARSASRRVRRTARRHGRDRRGRLQQLQHLDHGRAGGPPAPA